MGRAPRLCFLLFEGTCLDGVFVEHMLNNSVRWTMEPAWIIGRVSLLGAFRPVVRVTATLTTSCGSSEMATTTREPTSVQRQRLPPHQNSRPIWKSLRFIGDDPHIQGTQKYSALRRGEE